MSYIIGHMSYVVCHAVTCHVMSWHVMWLGEQILCEKSNLWSLRNIDQKCFPENRSLNSSFLEKLIISDVSFVPNVFQASDNISTCPKLHQHLNIITFYWIKYWVQEIFLWQIFLRKNILVRMCYVKNEIYSRTYYIHIEYYLTCSDYIKTFQIIYIYI